MQHRFCECIDIHDLIFIRKPDFSFIAYSIPGNVKGGWWGNSRSWTILQETLSNWSLNFGCWRKQPKPVRGLTEIAEVKITNC